MVDHIHFPKILPSVATAHKVKRAGSQHQERQHPSFHRFLKQNEDEDNEEINKKKAKKDCAADDPSQRAATSADGADEPDNDEPTPTGKRIDVHV